MKYLFVYSCFIICFRYNLSYGQHCDLCVHLTISGNCKQIPLDSIQYYELDYVLENCGDSILTLNADALPENEGDYSEIYFQVYSFSEEKKKILYEIQNHPSRISLGSEKILYKNDRFKYEFPLFKLFHITKPGKYFIKGFYKTNLYKGRGAYLQYSDRITLEVK